MRLFNRLLSNLSSKEMRSSLRQRRLYIVKEVLALLLDHVSLEALASF